jgi:LysM repeat protein
MITRLRHTAIALLVALALGLTPRVTIAATYLVQPDDTLSAIAASYGVSPAALAAHNGLVDPDLIVAGAVLTIPASADMPTVAGAATYQIQPEDTLSELAARFGTSVSALQEANPALGDPDQIQAGTVLRLAPDASPVAALLSAAAARHGLDPALLQAIAWQESGWRQNAASPVGAVGLMQLLPATGDWVGREIAGAPLDITGSAADNAEAGAAYFSWLLAQADDEDLALAYYVQGQASVARDGLYPETRAYIAAVEALRSHFARDSRPPT